MAFQYRIVLCTEAFFGGSGKSNKQLYFSPAWLHALLPPPSVPIISKVSRWILFSSPVHTYKDCNWHHMASTSDSKLRLLKNPRLKLRLERNIAFERSTTVVLIQNNRVPYKLPSACARLIPARLDPRICVRFPSLGSYMSRQHFPPPSGGLTLGCRGGGIKSAQSARYRGGEVAQQKPLCKHVAGLLGLSGVIV